MPCLERERVTAFRCVPPLPSALSNRKCLMLVNQGEKRLQCNHPSVADELASSKEGGERIEKPQQKVEKEGS